MPTPATTKLLDAVRTELDTAVTGVSFFTERSDQEPLSEDELPGVAIRLFNIGFITSESEGEWRWQASLQFDCQSGGAAGLTIDAVNQQTMASIIAALWNACDAPGADTNQLGQLVQLMEPEFADSSEQSAPDVGWSVLQYRVVFFTPPGDPFTIIGPSGAEF